MDKSQDSKPEVFWKEKTFILWAIPIIGSMLSQSVIDELAKHICLIVFGVYDGESYLVAHLNPTRK